MNKIFGIISKNNINNLFFNKNLFKKNNVLSSQYYFLNTSNNEPFIKYDCQNKYIIIYDGYLTNKKELKCKLRTLGYQFKTDLDEEIIINAYIYHKENSFNLLNGSYSFIIFGDNKITIVRDKIGNRSLFYSINNNYFTFSNEVKHLLNSNLVDPLVNDDGLKELFAIGPGFSNELTPYKDIKRLLPGQYIEFEDGNISKVTYYKLPIYPYMKSYTESKNDVYRLLNNSVKKLLDDKTDCCSLLSGGLDSSIISKLSTENTLLTTYFLDYKDNDIYFKANEFQLDTDKYYSIIMQKQLNTIHHDIVINEQELYENLINSLISRDMPGMGDIDSSLYILLNKIEHKYILNGEGSDEIFGGYPWFYEDLNNNYPWIRNIKEKQALLNEKYQYLNLENYLISSYNNLLNNYEELIYDNEINKKWRKLKYINIYSFLQQLLYRLESTSNSLDKISLSPFLDIELIELVYNLPKEYINYNNEKKGILKDIFKNYLPYEIINRNKTPYPKTYSNVYKKMVINKINEYIDNPLSNINKFFDKQQIKKLIENDNNIPFYGQLMTNIQFLSYLIQFEEWVKIYNIKFVK